MVGWNSLFFVSLLQFLQLCLGVKEQSKEKYGFNYLGEMRMSVCQVWYILMVFHVSSIIRTASSGAYKGHAVDTGEWNGLGDWLGSTE